MGWKEINNVVYFQNGQRSKNVQLCDMRDWMVTFWEN